MLSFRFLSTVSFHTNFLGLSNHIVGGSLLPPTPQRFVSALTAGHFFGKGRLSPDSQRAGRAEVLPLRNEDTFWYLES